MNIATDPVVIYAFWLGGSVASLAAAMLVAILVLRARLQHRDRVRVAAVARWRAVLAAQPGSEPETIPRLPKRDLPGFIQVWNEIHEALNGRTTPYLARVARELGLEARLARRLRRSGFHTRLLSMIALGNVHSASSYRTIERYLEDSNPTVSLCAARALMQMDPARAASAFIPQIVRRSDWSAGSLAAILTQAGPERVERELAEATLQANLEVAPRLLRFLAGVSPGAAAPIIRTMLQATLDERLLSTCLQVVTRPDDVDCVRPLLAHPRWHVRMQAAVALGRLGVPGDEQRLTALLSDKQWWVRYRAAQALHSLGFVGPDGLRTIQAGLADGYARDIIEQVLAEQALNMPTRAAA